MQYFKPHSHFVASITRGLLPVTHWRSFVALKVSDVFVHMLCSVMSGRGDELLDLAKTNLLR
jgi:hypothetical protein